MKGKLKMRLLQTGKGITEDNKPLYWYFRIGLLEIMLWRSREAYETINQGTEYHD
jgi:hypothetical protein